MRQWETWEPEGGRSVRGGGGTDGRKGDTAALQPQVA